MSENINQGESILLASRYGTPYYIAPETLLGELNCKSDIWSTGIILYMMLTGRPPFNGENDGEIIKNIRN